MKGQVLENECLRGNFRTVHKFSFTYTTNFFTYTANGFTYTTNFFTYTAIGNPNPQNLSNPNIRRFTTSSLFFLS